MWGACMKTQHSSHWSASNWHYFTDIIGRMFTSKKKKKKSYSNWVAYFVASSPKEKGDESSWSKTDSWGGAFS